jgi:predicted dehydrogenase
MKILVVGCGSIGERHISNLKTLSADEIIACDTNSGRLTMIKKKYDIHAYTDLQHAMTQKIDAVLVCTPPSTHIPIALKAIDYKAHVFIEKPMSDSLDGVDELIKRASKSGLIICVGYNFRFHQGLKLVKDMVDRGEIGKIFFARAEFGQYLPDWRPWQDYRQSYTAKKDLGGGIILDGSHEIDYMRWLLGDAEEIFCFAGKISTLEVETEDVAGILLEFKRGAIGEIHLDFVRHDYSRTCEIIGEKGTIKWSYQDRFVKVYSMDAKKWKTFDIKADPNDMYVQEMHHFINCVKIGEKPLIDGEEGKKTLEIVLLAKKSAETKEVIEV